jgi:hypothetical protein
MCSKWPRWRSINPGEIESYAGPNTLALIPYYYVPRGCVGLTLPARVTTLPPRDQIGVGANNGRISGTVVKD